MSVTGIGQRQRIPWYSIPKLLVGLLLGWWFVETTDSDGDRRIRRLYQDIDGKFVCRRIAGWVELHPDGTVTAGGRSSYVKSWAPLVRFGRLSFELPPSVGAVDPQATRTGTLTTRGKV